MSKLALKKKNILAFIILSIIAVIFFRKSIFNGLIPFPGDLLVSEYQPFRSYSYGGYSPGSVPNKAQYFDSIREFYPWRTFSISQLLKGRLPLWNPYNFSGTPHLSNYQTGVFYPLNLLYLYMNQVSAWTILIILQPLLASWFTFLYSRKIGISYQGSILAAITFAYSFFMSVWLEFNLVGHTILWLPLILYAVENLINGYKYSFTIGKAKQIAIWGGVLIFAFFSSLSAGHPVDFSSVALFSIIYVLFRVIGLKIRLKQKLFLLSIFLALIFIALLIGSVQLLPTLRLISHSTRAVYKYEFFDYDFFVNHMLIQPYQLIMLIIPDFFGNPATRNYWLNVSYVNVALSIGLPGIILASLSFFKKSSSHKTPKAINVYYSISALSILLLAVNNPLSQFIYKFQIPIISTNSPTRLIFLLSFSLSILAGFGVNQLLKEKSAKVYNKHFAAFFFIIAIGLASIKFLPPEHQKTALKNSIYSLSIFVIVLFVLFLQPLIAFFGIKKLNLIKKSVVILLVITMFDLFYAFNKFNPFSPKEFIFPKSSVITYLQNNAGINRFWGYGTARIESNIATQYKLFSPDGFDPLNLRWYHEFIGSSKNGKLQINVSHVDRHTAQIYPGYGETDLPLNKYRLRVLDVLGVKYILDRIENPKNENTFPSDRFKLLWKDKAGWRIFENIKAAPRFFLTTNIKTYNSNKEFENIFFSKEFNPVETILIHKKEFDSTIKHISKKPDIKKQSVKLISYKPNKISFITQARQSTFLFLSDSYAPSWKAYVDDDETRIYRANYAFRAISIPSGMHKVRLIYKPPIFSKIPDKHL